MKNNLEKALTALLNNIPENGFYNVWVEDIQKWVRHYYNGHKWRNVQPEIKLPKYYLVEKYTPINH